MPDRRRFVTVSAGGTVVTLLDVENGTTYQSVQDSFKVTAPSPQQTVSALNRRFGGNRVVGETHDNGRIGWTILFNAATQDLALAGAETLIGQINSIVSTSPLQVFFEWRPDGATNSTYFELRGPGTWDLTYSSRRFVQVASGTIDVSFPVAPLMFRDPVTQSGGVLTGLTFPAYIVLGTAIGGDAPALMDVALTTTGGATAPVFAMIGWSQRPGTPTGGSVAPFGVIEAETGASLSTWALTGVDATYRGSSGLTATTSGAGTASAQFVVDPATMTADVFSPRELDMEVWARVNLDGSVVSPTLDASLVPNAGTSFGAQRRTSEDPSGGHLLVRPSTAGTKFRFVRLGVVSFVLDPANVIKWNLKIDATWAAGSSGLFGIDYMILVPARQSALSPTRKPNDTTYPAFIKSTGNTSKLIRADGSAIVASGSTVPPGHPDAGLGGAIMEIPTGNVDLVVKLSSLVPDDPTSDATTEQLSHAGSLILTIWPRYWLARAV